MMMTRPLDLGSNNLNQSLDIRSSKSPSYFQYMDVFLIFNFSESLSERSLDTLKVNIIFRH